MFDFAWSEIALIGVVALVAIGPKDMPGAVRAVAGVVKKARRMAGEFQVHVDDLMKEADLSEVRTHLRELRGLDLRGTVARAIDPDGALRGQLAEKPFAETIVARPSHRIFDPPSVPPPDHMRPDPDAAPAFIPPPLSPPSRRARLPPAFIPPANAAPAFATPGRPDAA